MANQLLALVKQKITSKGGPFDKVSSICHVSRGPPLGRPVSEIQASENYDYGQGCQVGVFDAKNLKFGVF